MSLFKHEKTVWTLDGKQVPAGTPGAEKEVIKSKKWYARITENGKRVNIPLSTDRQASVRMLADRLKRQERIDQGLDRPEDRASLSPLATLVDAYESFLKSKCTSSRHVQTKIGRVRRIVGGCDFRSPSAIEPTTVTTWLESFAAAQDLSEQSRRFYVANFRDFVRWLVRSRKLERDPLISLETRGKITNRKRVRRPLAEEEIAKLLSCTRDSEAEYRGLTGHQRYGLYLTALATGFRAGALAELRYRDLTIDSHSASFLLAARFDKSKRGRVQPVALETARSIHDTLRDRSPDALLFPGTWSERCAVMLVKDLQAAGIAVEIQTSEGASKFDFHSLRHTFITNLARSGTSMRVVQTLAGHASLEIPQRYAHVQQEDLRKAAEGIRFEPIPVVPFVVPAICNRAQKGATGCEGKGEGDRWGFIRK